MLGLFFFFFSSRRRHTRCLSDWSSDVCSSDLFLFACGLFGQLAQGDRHVTWKLSVEPAAAPAGGKVLVRMAGHIDDGWHLYSMSTPAAIPTKIQLAPSPAVAKFRALEPQPKRAFDANFNSDTETYDGDVAFLLELEL